METDLRRAMARGEFVVYYQPIVTLPDRRIVAFEALLRWLHPEKASLRRTASSPWSRTRGCWRR
jgi:EAL domain-containing protein (putative c-di-GMP-specific phosphodiesterase class I)